MIVLSLTLLFCFSVFLFLRSLPYWKDQKEGCDAYYFLLSAEYFQKEKKLPITFPRFYLLESPKQYYPPLFSTFLSYLPANFLKKNYFYITHSLDFIALLFSFILINKFKLDIFFYVIVIYALQVSIIYEYRNLTSRPFAIILFNLFCLFSFILHPSQEYYISISIVLGSLIIFSHKLTMQLLIFLAIAQSLYYQNILFIIILCFSYGLCFLVNRKLLSGIIRAHIDIVYFWIKNWSLLGAHTVKESIVYKKNAFSSTKYYEQKFLLVAKKCFIAILRENYLIHFIWIDYFFYNVTDIQKIKLFFLITCIYIFSIVTWLFKPFRGFGLGQQYIKYSIVPSLLYISLDLQSIFSSLNYRSLFLYGLALLMIVQYIITTSKIRKQTGEKTNFSYLKDVTEEILKIKNKKMRFFCLPYSIADFVVYMTRLPVLWGTHGYGFRWIEDIFPVLKKPFFSLIKKYLITHIILEKDYCDFNDLKFKDYTIIYENEKYVLAEVIHSKS